MPGRRAEERPKDPRPEVLSAIEALRKGYEVGRTVLQQFGEHAKPGMMGEVAKAYGYTLDATRKLRQFATTYTDDELEELCESCRKHERALGLVFIYRLVSIKNKRRRAAFQRQAIKEHWGHARFVRELRRRFKLGHARGRRPHLPESVREALADIEEARARLVHLLKHCVSLADRTEAGSRQERQRLGRISNRLLAALVGDEARFRRATAASRRS